MEFADKTLKCMECGQDFVFTANEQKFYSEKGFQNEPKRCPACRQAKKHQQRGGDRGGYSGERVQTEIICAMCGQKASVPFKPTQNKPVYCNECFAKAKEGK